MRARTCPDARFTVHGIRLRERNRGNGTDGRTVLRRRNRYAENNRKNPPDGTMTVEAEGYTGNFLRRSHKNP